MKMDFETFKAMTLDALQAHYGKDAVEISFQEVLKNNDTKHTGVLIRLADGNKKAAPLLYIDQDYQNLCDDTISFDEYIDRLIETRKADNISYWDLDLTLVEDWEKAKVHVYPVLISAERNNHTVENLVSKDYLDMRIIYILRNVIDNGDNSSIRITKDMFERYGITMDVLHKQAMDNLRTDRYGFFRLEDLLFCLGGYPDPVQSIGEEGSELYCLTNNRKVYGAAGLLDIEMIGRAANGRNLYILPSSIHELLFLLDDGARNTAELNAMIREINQSTVLPDEVLSDHAYYYCAADREIRIAA